MKTLTETQKKWALTACLMTALSFNLSAHVKADKEISLDFASEGIAFDVTNSKGVRDAKAWKTGDNGEYTVKVEAAPGCNCEPETVDIKVQTDKQGKDLENLIKVATYAKIEAKGDRKAAPKADDEDSQDPNEDDDSLAISEQEEQREKLDREFRRALKTNCSHDDDLAKCNTNQFIGLLKKYEKRDKLKRPSDDQAASWFEGDIAEQLLASMLSESETPDISDYDNYYSYQSALRQAAVNQSKKMRDAKRSIESLIERLPKGYTETRRKIVQLVASVQRHATQQYVEKLSELADVTKSSPDQYQTKIATAQQYQQSMSTLTQELDSLVNAKCGGLEQQLKFKSSTCVAMKAGYVNKNEANQIYREEFGSTNLVAAVQNSVRTVPLIVNGHAVLGPNGVQETRVVIEPNVFASSFGPSNGNGPQSTMMAARDLNNGNRTVVVQKAPTSNIVYVGGKAYQEIGDVSTVEQTPSVVTTSDVLKFFDEMDATQQSIRARTELHRQYKINQ